jgi:quinol monooxygenase YgiN
MYARAVTIQLHPGKIAEAGLIMEEVADQLQGAAGFHQITLLADETTGHGHLISLWESEEAIAATAPTIFKGAMERLAPLFAAPPRPEILKVVMHSHRGE